MNARSHERVEFEHKPSEPSTIEALQAYVNLMIGANCRVVLTLDGEIISEDYWDDMSAWDEAFTQRLPQAQNFAIDVTTAVGTFCLPEEMWSILRPLKDREAFHYRSIIEYLDHDDCTEFTCIHNGEIKNIASLCEPNIAEKAKGCQFYGDLRCVYADFDHQAHPEIVQQLREAIRAYVTEEREHQALEKQWEELEEEGTFGYLFPHNYIGDDGDLSRTQRLVDQINQILAPIAEECTIYNGYPITRGKEGAPDPDKPYLSHCYYDQENFGVAALIWKDHRLQLVGAML